MATCEGRKASASAAALTNNSTFTPAISKLYHCGYSTAPPAGGDNRCLQTPLHTHLQTTLHYVCRYTVYVSALEKR
jgi:hypothetical protein